MKDTRVSVRMEKDLHQKLKILTIKKSITINDFLLAYIRKAVKKDEE